MNKCPICGGEAKPSRRLCNACVKYCMSIGRKKKMSGDQVRLEEARLKRELFFLSRVLGYQTAHQIIQEYLNSELERKAR